MRIKGEDVDGTPATFLRGVEVVLPSFCDSPDFSFEEEPYIATTKVSPLSSLLLPLPTPSSPLLIPLLLLISHRLKIPRSCVVVQRTWPFASWAGTTNPSSNSNGLSVTKNIFASIQQQKKYLKEEDNERKGKERRGEKRWIILTPLEWCFSINQAMARGKLKGCRRADSSEFCCSLCMLELTTISVEFSRISRPRKIEKLWLKIGFEKFSNSKYFIQTIFSTTSNHQRLWCCVACLSCCYSQWW